MMATVGRNM